MTLRTAGRAALASVALGGIAAAAPLPDARVAELLAALEGASRSEARAATERIVAAGDRRFAAVFVELMRASEAGIAAPAVRDLAAEALGRLSGESFGADSFAWLEWLEASPLEPPPGFTGFKGRLLARIDPGFGELLRDGPPSRIRVEEIVWGGVAYEGIPSLDRPRRVPAAAAPWLGPDEPVLGVALGGEARAYPLRILDWHELANDELGGIPFALAWCTLCGSGIAYASQVPGHGRLEFGSSGLLHRSNKLMVDRGTRTLWSQLTGRPVLGPLAAGGIRLAVLPSVVARWSDWRQRHPETTVLSLDTGHRRPYRPGAAYGDYFASPSTRFPVRRVRDELPEKERIFGIERDGVARAWPLAALLERRVLNDEGAGEALVLVAGGPRIRVEGESLRGGPVRYEAGAELRAFRRGAHEFSPGEGVDALIDERGRSWRVEEEALVGPDARLERVPGVLAYWFAWQAFHPRTTLYEAP